MTAPTPEIPHEQLSAQVAAAETALVNAEVDDTQRTAIITALDNLKGTLPKLNEIVNPENRREIFRRLARLRTRASLTALKNQTNAELKAKIDEMNAALDEQRVQSDLPEFARDRMDIVEATSGRFNQFNQWLDKTAPWAKPLAAGTAGFFLFVKPMLEKVAGGAGQVWDWIKWGLGAIGVNYAIKAVTGYDPLQSGINAAGSGLQSLRTTLTGTPPGAPPEGPGRSIDFSTLPTGDVFNRDGLKVKIDGADVPVKWEREVITVGTKKFRIKRELPEADSRYIIAGGGAAGAAAYTTGLGTASVEREIPVVTTGARWNGSALELAGTARLTPNSPAGAAAQDYVIPADQTVWPTARLTPFLRALHTAAAGATVRFEKYTCTPA